MNTYKHACNIYIYMSTDMKEKDGETAMSYRE